MRAVVQCVSAASVTDGLIAVNNEVVSQISKGLMILVGIGSDDTDADIATLSKKILSLRLFADPVNPQTMWKSSVKDIDGDILCVSQFTLYASTSKGNKPDFHRAMSTEPSRQLYAKFLEVLGSSYKPGKIQDGVFGAMMSVSLTNEGPVTITLDSRKFEYVDTPEAIKKSGKKSKTLPETKKEETPISSATSAS